MAEKSGSGLATQIAAGLIVALVIYLIGAAVGLLPSVLGIVAALWRHLVSRAELPWFVIWPLILCTASLLVTWFRPYRQSRGVRRYTEDSFFGVTAKWRWSPLRLRPVDIRVLCPRCSTRLVSGSGIELQQHEHITMPVQRFYASCERCNRQVAEGNVEHLIDRIERQIERNIETGDWRKKVAA